MNEQSIYQMFKATCEKYPDKPAYRSKKDGQWIPITWQEHQETCKKISKSFIALGLQKDDKMNILGSTRLEWVQCDFGAVSVGVVTVGIYPTLLAEDCAYIINHSDAVLLFAENQDQLSKILSMRKNLPKLKHIVIWDGAGSAEDGVITWSEFLDKGKDVSDEDFLKRTESLQPGDLASIVYTSGTTGVPKGAMITHQNLVFTSWSVLQCAYTESFFENLLFLPLAHVFARIVVYFCVRAGVSTSFAESIEKMGENMKEVRPHFFASVPRIFEKVYDKITQGVEDAGGIKKTLFDWALGVGYEVSDHKEHKRPVPFLLDKQYAVAKALVFKKIKAALGGRLYYAISGAAPLNVAIAKFFHACDVLILEGIGMTENTSFTNLNRYDNYKFGTVGLPGPGIEQKIAPDGEILFRGKNVMKGYYKNPEANAETIDKDGWLYTGDVGEIDDDGFLRVTDRKKDLIITAGGKNIAPQRIERIMTTSRYISQVMVYGDRKKYLVALITLDREQVEMWATEHAIEYSNWEELANHPKVYELVQKDVEERNQDLASFETIKKFIILAQDFTIDSGELTPTLKVKRKVVTERYRDQLERLYEEGK